MIDTLKMFGVSVLVVIVALLLTGNIGSTPGVGGTYELTKQYFSQGIEASVVDADRLIVGSASASSSANFGKACWTVTTQAGATQYVFFRSSGIATSSTSCN